MKNLKCTACGLVNFSSAGECRRCGVALAECAGEGAEEAPRRRSLKRRALAGVVLSLFALIGFYVSLLETSEGANLDQREPVRRAVDLIEDGGLTRDAFLLRRLANYRTTDNWWNRYVGHGEAYAATNFPFEIITLYPQFFDTATDDTERAVILLHEARHLAGGGEEEACASVWRDKWRLGWTKERYGGTRVWQNVSEYTRRHAPQLFTCGQDGAQDCADIAEAKK